MAQATTLFYRFIIDDVVAKGKPAAVQDGVDAAVLGELRARWEQKMVERGVMLPHGAVEAPVQQALPAPAPRQQAVNPPNGQQMGAMDLLLAQLKANPQLAATFAANNPALAAQVAHFQAQRQAQAQAQAAAAAAQQKRVKPEEGFTDAGRLPAPALRAGPSAAGPSVIPQRDGPADDGGEEGEEQEGEEHSDLKDEEELSSDSDNEDPAEEEARYNQNFVCCQFKSVKRTKNKWKVVLQDGIMHVEGKDYCFKTATGEFLF